jgi:hypothetical protein
VTLLSFIVTLLIGPALQRSVRSASVERKGKKVVLVRAQFNEKRDSLGFEWDFNPVGAVNDGSNDAFDTGLVLKVNGHDFRANKQWMTPEGKEYVLVGKQGVIKTTRRVRLLAKRGAARYVEIFENTGEQALTVKARVYTRLGNSCRSVLTSEGQPFPPGGSPAEKVIGLLCISSGNRPSIMFIVGDSKGEVRPTVQINSRRYVNVDYNFSLEPGQEVALLHLVSQRRGVNTAEVGEMFEPFYRRHPRDMEVGPELRRKVVNFGGSGGLIELTRAGSALQPMLGMLEAMGAERLRRDVLMLREETSMNGRARCEQMSVRTRFGELEIDPAQIGALVGNRPHSRKNILYLRNGEVLVGNVAADGLTFELGSGLTMELTPGDVDLLVTRPGAAGGRAPEDARGYLTTRGGTRLALAGEGDPTIHATTPWGMLELGLDQIHTLTHVREPQPFYRLVLRDGSSVPAIPAGEKLSFQTVRMGEVRIAPVALARITHVSAPVGEDSEDPVPSDSRAAHARLVGEDLVVGAISLEKLHLLTSSGVTAVDPAQIYRMERVGGSGTARFRLDLADGQRLAGELRENLLPLESGERKLQVPVERIMFFCQPSLKPEGQFQW